jgi:hypothetical protein
VLNVLVSRDMISKTIIDLLAEEAIDLPADKLPGRINDTFAPHRADKAPLDSDPRAEARLSTRKKLDILDWASIDRQLRSYGSSKIDDLTLRFIDEDARNNIIAGAGLKPASTGVFDFRSDSVPFAVKYNIAIGLSYSEAIGILSDSRKCEIYASEEVERVFRKYGRHIHPGLNRINFDELPLDMKGELIWPMVQNLYRALTVRKAARVFPEGVSGKVAYEALTSEFENDQLASQLSHLAALKYSDYEMVYFSDPSDLEVKYHVALYCLNHIGEIKPSNAFEHEVPPQVDEPTREDEQQHAENVKRLEEEYIAAFKRLNKDRSFWDRINLQDIFEMGKDVISAIKEEVRNFARLKQGIISRLAGRSKVAIENEELLRIIHGQNPDFGFASQYLAMFFQPSDYYSILGLDNIGPVTEKDVKDAFKRQAKIYHPDKNSSDPNKEEKEQRFKLLMEAKDALLKRLKSSRGEPPCSPLSSLRDDVSVTSYLGRVSRLFGEFVPANQGTHQHQEERKGDACVAPTGIYQDQEELEMETDGGKPVTRDESPVAAGSENENEYLGPYFEEMRILGSMIDGWGGKEVLVMGAGREPDDFSIPVILSRMGANVSAVDVNYRGPADYQGCQYFRASADRVGEMFAEEQFDIVISTAMFGVPFTNWAVREYTLNPFDENLKDRIKEFELEVLRKLLRLTKKGGIHFHYNRDLNPQSWSFDETDLKQMDCESAFHPQDLPNPSETWFLRK